MLVTTSFLTLWLRLRVLRSLSAKDSKLYFARFDEARIARIGDESC